MCYVYVICIVYYLMYTLDQTCLDWFPLFVLELGGNIYDVYCVIGNVIGHR